MAQIHNVLKRLAPPGTAAPIDDERDVPELCPGLSPDADPVEGEFPGYGGRLAPGIEDLDHRVFLPGIEVRRLEQDTVEVGRAIGCFQDEPLDRSAAERNERARVGGGESL